MTIDQEESYSFPTLNIDAIDKHFPKSSYRDGQKEAIEFVVNSFNDGKKIVILECPTGGGKSAIGMTMASMVPKSYYLTITKILQDQLTADFGDKIVDLKGRNAYPCTFYNRFGKEYVKRKLWSQNILDEFLNSNPSCSEGFCRTKWNSPDAGGQKYKCDKCFLTSGIDNTKKPPGTLHNLPPGMKYSACPYYEQVYTAIASRTVTMNFSSFLYQTQMTSRFGEPRDLLIIDECHNIESQLLDFISFSITDKMLSDHGIFIPELDTTEEYKIWMEDSKIHMIIFGLIKKARENNDPTTEENLSRLLNKYKMFLDNMNEDADAEWICEYDDKGSHRKLTMKPVFVRTFINKLLFKYANRVLMMSATVLDVNVMCRSLGIDRKHLAAYRLKNRFPKENRPIYIKSVAKMTGGRDRMHEWGPLLVKAVDKIVKDYPDEKGIIHTHNFAIMDYLIRRCDKSVSKRFLDQRNFKDKQVLLNEHKNGTNSILIAPAMHEGIDLIDDLSRFQIICKVPYPNCFDDKQLARRVEIDRSYYTWLTALKLVQSYGRSIRSPNDHAVTYILDESIYKFMSDANRMLPDWFKEAIIQD